jgi:DNA-binding transcriptional LysR family regulator
MIPRTTLEQWGVVQAIIEHGSYAKAAEALHRSQSSVSYMVARLHEQLGVELLAIEGRKAQLTAEGAVLLGRAKELLCDAQRLEQLAKSLRLGREPEVRLAADIVFPTRLLLTALTRFAETAPATRVQLREVVLSGADEALIDQTADLAIGAQVPPGFLGDLLVEVEFVAVARPGHPLHQLGRDITVEDLSREQQIVIRDSGTRNPRDSGWLGAARRWTVTSVETSISLVVGGLGFAWLPCHLVQPYIESNALKPLALREGQRRRTPFYLIFAQPELAGPATRELAQVLREAAQSRDDSDA